MNVHIIPALLAIALVAPAGAQDTSDHSAHHPAQVAQAPAMTAGEVRKVDKEAGKITLRHEPIASLDMPAMTMVFRVSDPKMLDTVKVGDKVAFSAEKVGGQFTVTRMQPAP
jgi:Cu(I)/Ag(I) efflux system protein CusF